MNPRLLSVFITVSGVIYITLASSDDYFVLFFANKLIWLIPTAPAVSWFWSFPVSFFMCRVLLYTSCLRSFPASFTCALLPSVLVCVYIVLSSALPVRFTLVHLQYFRSWTFCAFLDFGHLIFFSGFVCLVGLFFWFWPIACLAIHEPVTLYIIINHWTALYSASGVVSASGSSNSSFYH